MALGDFSLALQNSHQNLSGRFRKTVRTGPPFKKTKKKKTTEIMVCKLNHEEGLLYRVLFTDLTQQLNKVELINSSYRQYNAAFCNRNSILKKD